MPHPKVKLSDNSGNEVSVTDNRLDVNAAISGDISVALTTADQVSVFGNTNAAGSGTAKALLTDAAGHLQVDVLSLNGQSGPIGVDTELGAPVLLADDTANASITRLTAFGMYYDGSTWDRVRGTSSDGLLVNLGSNNDVTVSGTVTANLGTTDNAVLDAMVVDLAAIEALLITIDSDTNSTQGYLSNLSGCQYVDDANWTDGSSKHLLVGGLYQSSMQTVTDGDVAPFQIDANGVLRTSHSITTIGHGANTNISDSTAEVLGSSQDCKHIDIMASPNNTGFISVGGSEVGEGAPEGVKLYAGDVYSIDIDNVTKVFVLASVDGEDVSWTYFN